MKRQKCFTCGKKLTRHSIHYRGKNYCWLDGTAAQGLSFNQIQRSKYGEARQMHHTRKSDQQPQPVAV